MLAGARDFLAKPPSGDDLISAIRRSGEMAHSERSKMAQARTAALPVAGQNSISGANVLSQGKIVTVYSPKGGTGCTTVAVNLAIALNNEDTRVVLVDANLQFGDVAVFVNEPGKNTLLDIAPRVDELDPDTVQSIMIKHEPSGIHILAAPQRPEMAENVSANQFTKVLDYLKLLYAYVVVDTASLLTDITLAAIDAADSVVLVTTQDIPAIKSARVFLDLSQTLDIARERIVFIMNRFDKRITITPERVGENLKQEVKVVIPLDDRTVIPAVNRGVPFMLENKSQPAAKGILNLAEAVRAQLAAFESEVTSIGKR